jgi:hypothetical protein
MDDVAVPVADFKVELQSTRTTHAGRSGFPEISGRVIRVFQNSGSQISHPKLSKKYQHPMFREPDNSGSGSGFPDLPEQEKRLEKSGSLQWG